jgi:serine/threonine protein kinase
MSRNHIFIGQKQSWNLVNKIGAGDAGEVFLVESLTDSTIGVLKKPSYSSFAGDIVRQASQIEQEGKILETIVQLNSNNNQIRTPKILDRSRSGTGLTDQFFIVISVASGFDLSFIVKSIHFGHLNHQPNNQFPREKLDNTNQLMLDRIIQERKIPTLILLRIIDNIIEFLETIHVNPITYKNQRMNGIIWNDIKLDHIFWNPRFNTITLIDFGNAKFVDKNGRSFDQQFTILNDYQQFLDEFSELLSGYSNNLHEELNWQNDLPIEKVYTSGILDLKEIITEKKISLEAELKEFKEQETKFRASEPAIIKDFIELQNIQENLLLNGEIPDLILTSDYFNALAKNYLENNDLESISQLINLPTKIPFLNHDVLSIMKDIISLELSNSIIIQYLIYTINEDWVSLIWELKKQSLYQNLSSIIDQIIPEVRKLAVGNKKRRPKIELNRVIFALKSINHSDKIDGQLLKELIEKFDKISQRWVELEPDPPLADIRYDELKDNIHLLENYIPNSLSELSNAISNTILQVDFILEKWDKKEFGSARLGLRELLLLDPERIRVFSADRAMQSAQEWVDIVKRGPAKDESLIEFITRCEIEGREIRIRTGPASWLDTNLSILRELRNNIDPTEALMKNKEGFQDFNWLTKLDPNRPIISSSSKKIHLNRISRNEKIQPTLFGISYGFLGENKDISLKTPLDTWAPEAKGSSARVYQGEIKGMNNRSNQVAIKIMRPDQIEYALPLFIEEIQVLSLLNNIPGIINLYESGFIRSDDLNDQFDDSIAPISHEINGEVVRYGRDSVHHFLWDIEKYTNDGYIPYLALEEFTHEDNLIKSYDIGYNKGRFQPIINGLVIAIQICDILSEIHSRNIVYRDHKILHYYWSEEHNGVHIIDWNIAKRHPEGLTREDIQFDLVQFGARGLHHIFTGRSAPGALPLGPNLSTEVENAAKRYHPNWTYDDQRLPDYIKDLLEKVLSNEYQNAKNLRNDLFDIFSNLMELINHR